MAIDYPSIYKKEKNWFVTYTYIKLIEIFCDSKSSCDFCKSTSNKTPCFWASAMSLSTLIPTKIRISEDFSINCNNS